MTAGSPCILVVDADRTATSLVHAGLAGSGFRVVEAHDGAVVLPLIQRERPVLVVLAIQLPTRSGLELVRLIRSDRQRGALPIILLGPPTDASERIQLLDLGADDYVAKPFHPREVAARIRALLRRRAFDAASKPGDMLQAGELVLFLDSREAVLRDQSLALTPTEFRLLEALMSHPGRAFARAELIAHALGSDFAGHVRTLDSHMRNLRAKLERGRNRTHYVQTVFGHGYRLVVPKETDILPPAERADSR